MKTFWCDDHDFVYPVGCASVVMAETEDDARRILDEKLMEQGLKPWRGRNYKLKELFPNTAQVINDGNY